LKSTILHAEKNILRRAEVVMNYQVSD